MIHSPMEWLHEQIEILPAGGEVRLEYDSEGDILEVFFAPGPATGIELTDEIVLRYDRVKQSPRSLIFTSFSHLIQDTEYGPESFRLTGIEALPAKQQDEILRILRTSPVNHFLQLSAMHLPHSERLIPLTLVRRMPLAA